ncbi:MAG: hypothetical protein ACI4Q5_06985, partial [Porcipelethomonas sp.]
MELTELLTHFRNVEKSGDEYRANCPACGDDKQHLYIHEADGKILADCKKGCTFSAIASAAGLAERDFFNDRSTQFQRWTKLREHIYTNPDGQTIARKTIYDKGNGSKTALWERFEKGRYLKKLNGLKVPPYHVHKLSGADTVFIAEGEKDVETLEKMGYTASTSPNGAGAKWSKAYNGFFKGKTVIVLADNDSAGRKHGAETANSLSGTASGVYLIPSETIYPELKNKGDISDIVSAVGLEKAHQLLETAVKSAVRYERTADKPVCELPEGFDDTGELTINNLTAFLKS